VLLLHTSITVLHLHTSVTMLIMFFIYGFLVVDSHPRSHHDFLQDLFSISFQSKLKNLLRFRLAFISLFLVLYFSCFYFFIPWILQSSKRVQPQKMHLSRILVLILPMCIIYISAKILAILVSSQLNEQNYHSWSRNMKRAFLSKNKLKFVDGTF